MLLAMICTSCSGPGVFWVEQNGRPRRLLCDHCTRQALQTVDPMAARFFAEWMPVRDTGVTELHELPDDTRCPGCGTTFGQFERQGLLGCAACYRAFAGAVMPALAILHGAEGPVHGE